jgi:formylglycine-generating enzyme required for sulfatase activity
MHGNVWEWCADHWHDNYLNAPTDGRAWLTRKKNQPRSLRGGAWNREPWACRSTYRDRANPDTRNKFIGFRIVCEVGR